MKSIKKFQVTVKLDGDKIVTHDIREDLISIDKEDKGTESEGEDVWEESDYEKKREKKIERNKKYLGQLGF